MSEEQSEQHKETVYPELDHLWEFAGRGLGSSEFNTAMVHFYRAEVSRSNTWRTRLDSTTNWAVISTGAALTFSFTDPQNTHLVILMVTLLVLLFLFIEARRYRYYELWTSRVRLMETNFFTRLLSPPYKPDKEWAARVTESLTNPRFPITLREAFGRRYRRNYAFIFFILALSWIFKVAIHPVPAYTFDRFLRNASVGPLSGEFVLTMGVIVNGVLVIMGILTAGMQESPSEVLADSTTERILGRLTGGLRSLSWEVLEIDLPQLAKIPQRGDAKQMAYIVTDNADAVSKALIEKLGRGVTQLRGEGMYTGQEHGVLMVAFRARQARQLERVVEQVDPEAFLIILGVRDVRGAGFRPLEA